MEFNTIKPVLVGKLTGSNVPKGLQIDSATNNYIPLPPLVTAALYDGNTLLTRVTLLVDAKVTDVWLNEDPTVIPNSLVKYVFAYDRPDTEIPTEFGVWYAEYPLTVQRFIPLVQVFLRDDDPETSRGTVTTVQES